MKVDLYTLCWNEIKILPFVIEYWENIKNQVDDFHAYVYDNGSNDGSIEYLKKFNWITVNHFDSDGFNDSINKDIKNSAWKESRNRNVDFAIICDLDECLYYPNLKSYFQSLKDDGITLVEPQWWDGFSDKFPVDDGRLLNFHDEVTWKVNNSNSKFSSKVSIINPNKIDEINYSVGAHTCYPTGKIKKSTKGFILHLKYFSKDYIHSRYDECAKRLSSLNKQMKWGYQYNLSKAYIDENFDNNKSKSIPWDDVIKNYYA